MRHSAGGTGELVLWEIDTATEAPATEQSG